MRHEDFFKPGFSSVERARLTAHSRRGRIMCVIRAIEDHWIGDLIGAVCLFGTIIAIFIIAGVLS